MYECRQSKIKKPPKFTHSRFSRKPRLPSTRRNRNQLHKSSDRKFLDSVRDQGIAGKILTQTRTGVQGLTLFPTETLASGFIAAALAVESHNWITREGVEAEDAPPASKFEPRAEPLISIAKAMLNNPVLSRGSWSHGTRSMLEAYVASSRFLGRLLVELASEEPIAAYKRGFAAANEKGVADKKLGWGEGRKIALFIAEQRFSTLRKYRPESGKPFGPVVESEISSSAIGKHLYHALQSAELSPQHAFSQYLFSSFLVVFLRRILYRRVIEKYEKKLERNQKLTVSGTGTVLPFEGTVREYIHAAFEPKIIMYELGLSQGIAGILNKWAEDFFTEVGVPSHENQIAFHTLMFLRHPPAGISKVGSDYFFKQIATCAVQCVVDRKFDQLRALLISLGCLRGHGMPNWLLEERGLTPDVQGIFKGADESVAAYGLGLIEKARLQQVTAFGKNLDEVQRTERQFLGRVGQLRALVAHIAESDENDPRLSALRSALESFEGVDINDIYTATQLRLRGDGTKAREASPAEILQRARELALALVEACDEHVGSRFQVTDERGGILEIERVEHGDEHRLPYLHYRWSSDGQTTWSPGRMSTLDFIDQLSNGTLVPSS